MFAYCRQKLHHSLWVTKCKFTYFSLAQHIFFLLTARYTPKEAVGSYLHELILETPYREAFVALLSSYTRTGKPEVHLHEILFSHSSRIKHSGTSKECIKMEPLSL